MLLMALLGRHVPDQEERGKPRACSGGGREATCQFRRSEGRHVPVQEERGKARAWSGGARGDGGPGLHYRKWGIASCPAACVAQAGPHGGSVPPPLCYAQPDCNMYGSTLDGFRKIVRREGVSALWKGTDVALLMAVPMVLLFFIPSLSTFSFLGQLQDLLLLPHAHLR